MIKLHDVNAIKAQRVKEVEERQDKDKQFKNRNKEYKNLFKQKTKNKRANKKLL